MQTIYAWTSPDLTDMVQLRTLECWSPFAKNTSAEKNRRVRRGLEPSRLDNWSVFYYTCRGQILRSLRCTRSQTRADPARHSIKTFCHRDEACCERLQDLGLAYVNCTIACTQAAYAREKYSARVRLVQQARHACGEWESRFGNHRGCRGKREGDREVRELIGAGMRDEDLLDADPGRIQRPDPERVRR